MGTLKRGFLHKYWRREPTLVDKLNKQQINSEETKKYVRTGPYSHFCRHYTYNQTLEKIYVSNNVLSVRIMRINTTIKCNTQIIINYLAIVVNTRDCIMSRDRRRTNKESANLFPLQHVHCLFSVYMMKPRLLPLVLILFIFVYHVHFFPLQFLVTAFRHLVLIVVLSCEWGS